MNSFYGQNHRIDLREHTQIESQVCQLRATALARAFNEIDSFHNHYSHNSMPVFNFTSLLLCE